MQYYRCSIVTSSGKKLHLLKEAVNEQELASSFNNTDQILIKYTPVEDKHIAHSKKNYNRDIILEFTEIMTSLLKAGLTVQDSVALCASIARDQKTIWLCKSLLNALQRGLAFHKALEMHSPSFSSLYQSLVKLGEQTGSVASVFERMSAYLRNEKKIRGKIGNVIWYPLMVLTAAVAGSAAIIAIVMPRMAEIFTAFRAGTDQETVIELEQMYRSVWLFFSIIILVISVIIICVILRKYSHRFAFMLDSIFLRIPVFGVYIKAMQTMDFSFAMEMLTSSGINIHTALRETISVIRNRAYANAVNEVYSMLLNGEHLSLAFSSFDEFPGYIATWLAVGEKTGEVDSVFTQIRGYFQEDVERMSEKLINLLEPSLILLVGIIVLILIIQFLLPLFSLYGRLL